MFVKLFCLACNRMDLPQKTMTMAARQWNKNPAEIADFMRHIIKMWAKSDKYSVYRFNKMCKESYK